MPQIVNHQWNANEFTMTYHYIPIRMATIKHIDNIKYWPGCKATGTLIHCWRKWKKEDHLAVSHKVNTPTIWPTYYLPTYVLLLCIYPREMKSHVHKKVSTWMFLAASTILVSIEKTQMSIDREVNKQLEVYLYSGKLLSNKNETWNILLEYHRHYIESNKSDIQKSMVCPVS